MGDSLAQRVKQLGGYEELKVFEVMVAEIFEGGGCSVSSIGILAL